MNPKVLARVSNRVKRFKRYREGTVSGHKYKTGQLVDYLGRERASGVYKITLPPEGEAFQYRSRTSTNLTNALPKIANFVVRDLLRQS